MYQRACLSAIASLILGWTVLRPASALGQDPRGRYVTTISQADVLSPNEQMLVGTWQITFGDSSKYGVVINGQSVVEGQYTVKGNELTVDKETGPLACTPAGFGPGHYTWKKDGTALALTKVTDECDPRAAVMTRHPLTPLK